MRKRYDAKFKAKVVLEARREQNTAADIAAKSELYRQIGQLKYEVNWLKKSEKLGQVSFGP